MRTLVLAIAVFVLVAPALGQCPTITVIGPPGVTQPGEKMIFRVESAIVEPKVEYRWTVSDGTIIEGQGTPAITVATDRSMAGANVTAAVDVDGLASGCKKSASGLAPVMHFIEGQPVDQYGTLKANDERTRLDTFFIELANNPTSIGLIVLTGVNQRHDSRNPRIRLIVKHIRFREFDLERIWFAFEESGVRRTVLWRVPPGADLPCDECPVVKGGDLK